MFSKDRQPPRFVPTLTEVVTDKPEEVLLNTAQSAEQVLPVEEGAEPALFAPQTELRPAEQGVLVPRVSSVAGLNDAQVLALSPDEMQPMPAVPDSLQPDWAALCTQVESQVQSRLPQLLEPLWQKFQLDASQVIQDCVQQTLAQAIVHAQSKPDNTKS